MAALHALPIGEPLVSRLTMNDDGITVPLMNGKKPVLLPEPSIEQLAQMHVLVHEVDGSLPPLITILDPENASQEELAEATKAITERTLATYSFDAPYGHAMVKIIGLLAPDRSADVSFADLPGWCASATACRMILQRFQNPLPG